MNFPSCLQLLRIPYSFFLLPVFLFAFSFSEELDLNKAFELFVVLHAFIYPASYGFNSYIDQDITPVGGLRNPPKADICVLILSLLMNVAGVGLAYYIDPMLGYLALAYALASIAYSIKFIRIKRYGLLGFIGVVFFQGFLIYSMVYLFCQKVSYLDAMVQNNFLIPAILSSVLTAGIFPLSQVYQHKADEKSGDRTISRMLGIRGTFEFSAAFILVFGSWMGFYLTGSKQSHLFYLFLCFVFPIVAFYIWWAYKVWDDQKQANYRYTMIFHRIYAGALVLYFILVFFMRGADGLPVY